MNRQAKEGMRAGYALAERAHGMERSMMQKRHFELIARVVARIDDEEARLAVAYDFARELAKTNPAFDRARFLAACSKERDRPADCSNSLTGGQNLLARRLAQRGV